MRSNRVATESNELLATFSLARSEALRSPQGSGICTSTDGATCGGTWNDGWLVWSEGSNDDLPGGTGDRVLRYMEANDGLTFAATSSGPDPTKIRFDPRGRIDNNVTHTVTLVPTNCPAGQELRRSVALSATGQTRISKAACT